MSIEKMAGAHAQARSSGEPEAVVAFYRDDGKVIINRGDPVEERTALLDMVSGFCNGFPGLIVRLERLRVAGDHLMFGRVLEGKHAETGNQVAVPG